MQNLEVSGAVRYIYIYIYIIRRLKVKMRNLSDKSCRENRNTHFMFNNFFFENIVPYEIMLNIVSQFWTTEK